MSSTQSRFPGGWKDFVEEEPYLEVVPNEEVGMSDESGEPRGGVQRSSEGGGVEIWRAGGQKREGRR